MSTQGRSQQTISRFFQPAQPRYSATNASAAAPRRPYGNANWAPKAAPLPAAPKPDIAPTLIQRDSLKRFSASSDVRPPKRARLESKKFASIDLSAKEPKESQDGEDGEEEEEDNDEVREAVAAFAAPGIAGRKAPKAKKFTAMVQQYIEIKKENMDIILAFEVGYKFYFYGQDAKVASKELNIFLVPGWNSISEAESDNRRYEKFASAMVPVPRIYVHVKRLIEKGYKVGIVRQTETAALKAASANRNTPFNRKLTEVYTKGTFLDSFNEGGVRNGDCQSGYVCCLCEDQAGAKVTVGLLAFAPSTGNVVYEEFTDGYMRSELETRVMHIQPCEIVFAGEISRESQKVLKTVVTGQDVRTEAVARPCAPDLAGLPEHFASFPPLVKVCVSAMRQHLKQYNLERIFEVPSGFENFKSQACMTLNANALSSLEIYRNQTDHTPKGSLFWIVDQTRTRFGQRLLRSWVGNPLTDREQLELRVQAVEEIMNSVHERWQRLTAVLARLPDLENGLVRIHYGRCSRSELLQILRAFDRVCREFPAEKGFASEILKDCFDSLPKTATAVSEFLDKINADAAAANDKYHFFRSEEAYPAIDDEKMGILQVESELDEYLVRARGELKKSYLKYSTVAGTEYVIELRNTELRNVPKSWIKISGTKSVSRFHPPEVVGMLKEREQRRESLIIACDTAYAEFLADVAGHYGELRATVRALATLDSLISLAAVSKLPGYVKPRFVDRPCVEITAGRHAMVEQLLLSAFVPNSISLNADTHAVIMTGPNMGGKSSYVRQTALIAIMAQVGCYVPAGSATLGLVDAVYTRMGAYDNMLAGESTFMVELHECASIMRACTPRSLVLLDEIGRGTGPVDGVAIAYAVLMWFVEKRALTLFITHYPLLCGVAEKVAGVDRFYMAYVQTQSDPPEISYLYQAVQGVAHRSYGLNVARLADLPAGVIEAAAAKAKEVEEAMTARQDLQWALKACRAVAEGDVDALEGLVDYL